MKTRKFLSLLLSLVLIASFASIPALAEEPAPEPETFNPGIADMPATDYTLLPTTERKGDTTVSTASAAVAAAIAAKTLKLDLSAEKLFVPEGVTVAAYSVDGGSKWKVAALGAAEGADIGKLLNKECTLWLATSWDKKTKAPTLGTAAVAATADKDAQEAVEGAVVIKFEKIAARPKADKLVINYKLAADATGKTAGQWVLTAKDAPTVAVKDKLQIALSDNKKTPNNDIWGVFPAAGGINVEPLGDNTKVAKRVYVVRVQPNVTTGSLAPASKAFKVTASSELKALKLKADYKKEVIKAKEGLNVFFGDDITKVDVEKPFTKDAPNGTLLAGMTKDSAKAGVDISTYLTEKRKSVILWLGATDKKPATAKQTISLAARAYLLNEELAPAKGKVKVDTKKFQIFNAEKSKWAGLPKVEGAKTLDVRYKATAKGGAENDTTFAASATGGLVLGWGSYDAAKPDKKGIVSALVKAPEYAGVLTAIAQTKSVSVVYNESADVKFDVTGLVKTDTLVSTAAADKISFAVQSSAADVTVTSAAFASGVITATVKGAKAGAAVLTVEFTVGEDAANEVDYYPELFSCIDANVTVTPKEITLPSKEEVTVASLTKTAVKYTFDLSAYGALVGATSGIWITDNSSALQGVAVAYSVNAGIVTASVTGTVTTTTAQKLVLTLAVDPAKTGNYVAAADAAKTVNITAVNAADEQDG